METGRYTNMTNYSHIYRDYTVEPVSTATGFTSINCPVNGGNETVATCPYCGGYSRRLYYGQEDFESSCHTCERHNVFAGVSIFGQNQVYYTCSRCNRVSIFAERQDVAGRYYCPDCYNRLPICSLCSEPIVGDRVQCSVCRILLHPYCTMQDSWGRHYCGTCYRGHMDAFNNVDAGISSHKQAYIDKYVTDYSYIFHYSFKPDTVYPQGYNKGDRIYGMEFEFNCEGGRRKLHGCLTGKYPMLQALKEEYDYNNIDYVYAKADSSVAIEFVSQPFSLEEWLGNSIIEDLCLVAQVNEMTSHNTGIHIHVSKDSLDKVTIEKLFMVLWNPKNEQFFRLLSHKDSSQWKKYCAVHGYHSDYGTFRMQYQLYADTHTSVINERQETLEFRGFKNIINENYAKSALIFVDSLINYCQKNQDNLEDFAFENHKLIGEFYKKYIENLQRIDLFIDPLTCIYEYDNDDFIKENELLYKDSVNLKDNKLTLEFCNSSLFNYLNNLKQEELLAMI